MFSSILYAIFCFFAKAFWIGFIIAYFVYLYKELTGSGGCR